MDVALKAWPGSTINPYDDSDSDFESDFDSDPYGAFDGDFDNV
jgi:hypothetical protein